MSEILRPSYEGGADEPEHKLIPIICLKDDYATAPTWESFDLRANLREAYQLPYIPYGSELFLFAFGSRLKSDISPESELFKMLLEADKEALKEAMLPNPDGSHSGLLSYFAGEPNDLSDCKSLCVWTSFEQALSKFGPMHAAAMELAPLVYERLSPEWYHMKLLGEDEQLCLYELDRDVLSARYN